MLCIFYFASFDKIVYSIAYNDESGIGTPPPPLPMADPSPPLEYFDSICPPERLIILVAGRPKNL